jgi:hypothetical protein
MGAGGDCNISYVTVPTRNGLAIPLPSGTTPITIPDAFQIAADAPNDCQGREFTKNLTLTASTP